MEIQPIVTARNLTLTPDVEAEIRDRALALERFYPRLVRCDVTLEGPGDRHRNGSPFGVHITLGVPGADDLHVKRATADALAPAIRDAFDTARRRLQDFARQQRGD